MHGKRRPALVVGLTGGIASGKSTVARLFEEAGVPVVDADVVARDVVAPGLPALAEIVARFGPDVLDASGALDRTRMRERVFDVPQERQALEAILHPRIVSEMKRRIRLVDAPYCVLCIPLLLETGQRDLVDRVLVVDTPPQVQLRRARERDGSSASTIEGIMGAQASRETRLEAADDVIVNDQDCTVLRRRVRALHRKYSEIAGADLPATGN